MEFLKWKESQETEQNMPAAGHTGEGLCQNNEKRPKSAGGSAGGRGKLAGKVMVAPQGFRKQTPHSVACVSPALRERNSQHVRSNYPAKVSLGLSCHRGKNTEGPSRRRAREPVGVKPTGG